VVDKTLYLVPDLYKEAFKEAQTMLKTHQEFLAHPDWEVSQETKDSKLYVSLKNKRC
jgi:hypothetical protein